MSNGIGWISRSNHQSSSSAFLRILKIPQAFPTIRNNAETNREASPRRPPQIGKTNHHNCCKQQKTFNLRWVMADNPESKIIPNQNKKNPSRFKWKYKIKKKEPQTGGVAWLVRLRVAPSVPPFRCKREETKTSGRQWKPKKISTQRKT